MGKETTKALSQPNASAGLQSLTTGLVIVEFFARREEPIGVTAIAKALGLPKAKIHRYLTTLRDLGYLTQDPGDERYRAGWGLYVLGHDIRHNFSMVRLARPAIEAACRRIEMTIVMSVSTGSEFVVIDFAAPPSPLEMGLRPGSRFPLNSGAQGKIALAFGESSVFDEFVARPLEKMTQSTVVDPAALAEEIESVRERGWADAPDQLFLGVNAVAVPVFGPAKSLVGAIAAVGMTSALASPPPPDVVGVLKSAADDISQRLGSGGVTHNK